MGSRLLTPRLEARYLCQIPLSEGATGASTAAKTESFASLMSCCVNLPDLAQSMALRKDCSVSVECGSLETQGVRLTCLAGDTQARLQFFHASGLLMLF